MATTKPTTVPPKRLAEEITSSALTFKPNNILGWDGKTDLTSGDFGSVAYGVFRNDTNTQIEIFQYDPSTLANYATTGVTINLRGLSFDGTSLTESSDRKYSWPRNETIIELGSHVPQLLNDFVSKGRDSTVTGVVTFSNSAPPRASGTITYGAGAEKYFVTYEKLVATALASAVAASTTSAGYVEEATQAEVNAGTDTGGTGARLFVPPSKIADVIQRNGFCYAVEDGSGADDTYTASLTPAITAYTAGMVVLVKLTVANTGACTLNLNGVGAKTIKKYATGALADLETGDIVANMSCLMYYDGTYMVLLNPGATVPTTALLSEMAAFFGATDITGAEAETLTSSASNDATEKHFHSPAFWRTTSGQAMGRSGATLVDLMTSIQLGASPDGADLYIVAKPDDSGTWSISRFSRDTVTGNYRFITGITFANNASNAHTSVGVVVGATYVYAVCLNGAASNIVILRVTRALASETVMTISGSAITTPGWACGNDNIIYVAHNGATNTIYQYSVSGTTATRGSDITVTGINGNEMAAMFFDGTDILLYDLGNSSAPLTRINTSGAVQGTVNGYAFQPSYGGATASTSDFNGFPLGIGPMKTGAVYTICGKLELPISTDTSAVIAIEGYASSKP